MSIRLDATAYETVTKPTDMVDRRSLSPGATVTLWPSTDGWPLRRFDWPAAGRGGTMVVQGRRGDMLGLRSPVGRWGWRLARFMRDRGDPGRAAWKVNERPNSRPLRQALLTSDLDRYAGEVWWHAQAPEHAIRIAALLPGCELHRFGRTSAHEISREADPVRSRALAAIDAFVA